MENSDTPAQGPGSTLLAAIPTGDVADASSRFTRALGEVEIIAVEDTRRLLGLTNRLQTCITGTLISLHDHSEADKAECSVDLAEGGARALFAFDAGMPTVSDPGFWVVRAAVNRGAQVSVPPGPSVPTTVLVVSEFPSDRSSFEGFLPRKSEEAQAYFLVLIHDSHTLIFFESPKRLNETLCAMAITFGPQRQGVVCRELTKTHEEILRGEPESLVEQATGEAFGEITTVIAGYRGRGNAEGHVPAVLALVSEGMRLKDTAAEVAGATGLHKNELYKAALRRKEKG